jgi:beta-galactosidase
VNLDVVIDNDSDRAATVTIASDIFALDADGFIEGDGVASVTPERATIAARSSATVRGTTTVADPKLWGPPPTQQPNRYVAVATVTRDGQPIDRFETRFGIRDLRFDPERGVLVNGEHAAFPDRVIQSSENAAPLSSRGDNPFPVTPGSSPPVKDGARAGTRRR